MLPATEVTLDKFVPSPEKKLAVTKLPKLALPAEILPAKIPRDPLTLPVATTLVPLKFTASTLAVKIPVVVPKLPTLALPVTINLELAIKFDAVKLPLKLPILALTILALILPVLAVRLPDMLILVTFAMFAGRSIQRTWD